MVKKHRLISFLLVLIFCSVLCMTAQAKEQQEEVEKADPRNTENLLSAFINAEDKAATDILTELWTQENFYQDFLDIEEQEKTVFFEGITEKKLKQFVLFLKYVFVRDTVNLSNVSDIQKESIKNLYDEFEVYQKWNIMWVEKRTADEQKTDELPAEAEIESEEEKKCIEKLQADTKIDLNELLQEIDHNAEHMEEYLYKILGYEAEKADKEVIVEDNDSQAEIQKKENVVPRARTAQPQSNGAAESKESVAMIGQTQYGSLKDAWDAANQSLGLNVTIQLLKSCTVSDVLQSKSGNGITVKPVGGNWTITLNGPGRFISGGEYGADGASTITFSGNGGNTLTIDGKNGTVYDEEGILDVYRGSLYLLDGVRVCNSKKKWAVHGFEEDDNKIYISGDVKIYNNFGGVGTWSALYIYGAKITGSSQFPGIHVRTERSSNAVYIRDTTVKDNVKGIQILGNSPTDYMKAVDVLNCEISNNQQEGLEITDKANASFKVENTAITFNGTNGIRNPSQTSTIFVKNSTIKNNGSGSPNGGGIYNVGTVQLLGVNISDNNGGRGGGIYNTGDLGIGIATDRLLSGGITYHTYTQTYAWQPWVNNIEIAGTVGEAKRMEGIQASLTGEVAEHYDITYRVYMQSYGWLEWVSNGVTAGRPGEAKGIEAIQMKLAPKSSLTNVKSAILYSTYLQGTEWTDWAKDGEISGTTGEGKRLEAISIKCEIRENTNRKCTIINNHASELGGGICNYGTISACDGNMRGNTGAKGESIYQNGVLNIKGAFSSDESNDIYLEKDKFVTINGKLTNPSGVAARLTPSAYRNGRKMTETAYGTRKGSEEYLNTDGTVKFKITPKDAWTLRPADYQASEAKTSASDIVISTEYHISYDKNTDAKADNIPDTQKKYWYESTALSNAVPTWISADFLGWNTDASAKKAAYQPSQEIASDVNKDIKLFAIWQIKDKPPTLSEENELEFYEGTEVTKEMLLQGVRAIDAEDGDITGQIKITEINYADGKIENGKKQKGEKKQWKQDMPDEEKLDTWFLQLDEKDSPVTHEVTYRVRDSFEHEVSMVRKVKVKYNQFPVIEAQDRYFTLAEAQRGEITEELLLHKAVEEGRTVIKDQEDDELYPGTISGRLELVDFHAEEFISFSQSGYVVLSYSVKDSMGPEGKGKETMRQFTVHVVEDGEQPKEISPQYVRFINKDNYYREDQADSKSKWHIDDDYRGQITGIWANSQVFEAWHFDAKDIINVKKYVKEHGLGNSNPDRLKGFLAEFADSKIL